MQPMATRIRKATLHEQTHTRLALQKQSPLFGAALTRQRLQRLEQGVPCGELVEQRPGNDPAVPSQTTRHEYAPFAQLQLIPGPVSPLTFPTFPIQSSPQDMPALQDAPP